MHQRFKTVHLGHLNVEEDNVRVLFLCDRQTLPAARSTEHFDRLALQRKFQEIEIVFRIVND